MSTFRRICGAAYNDEHKTFEEWKGVSFGIWGKEIAPTTGRIHQQYYLEFATQKKFQTIKNRYPMLHFQSCNGNAKQNIEYCSKDHTEVYQFGEPTKQGDRTDLKELCDQVRLGECSYQDILINNPMMVHKYGRTLQQCEDYFFSQTYRTEMTKCTWYWGPTATGKSHRAYENYHPATHYNYPYDKDWWDGYRGHDTVIINDFRGQIKYDQLLRLIDKHPHSVSRRCLRPRPFVSKHIIITSSLPPGECFPHRCESDSIQQLIRRCEVIHLTKKFESQS